MPKFRFSLREIDLINGQDGQWPFHSNLEIEPIIRINGSLTRKTVVASTKGDIDRKVHSFDDVWCEIEVPENEFAMLAVFCYEVDTNHEAVEAIKNQPINSLASYALPASEPDPPPDLHGAALVTSPTGVPWIDIPAFTAALIAFAIQANGDDPLGLWFIRVAAKPNGAVISAAPYGGTFEGGGVADVRGPKAIKLPTAKNDRKRIPVLGFTKGNQGDDTNVTFALDACVI